jgi:hypothetical protein
MSGADPDGQFRRFRAAAVSMPDTACSRRVVFSRSSSAEAVAAFFAGVAAAMSTTGWFGRPWVSVEVTMQDGELSHVLHAPALLISVLEQQLLAQLPTTRWEPTPAPVLDVDEAVELRLSVGVRRLRVDRAEAVSAAILQSLAAAGPGEVLVLQWVFAGAHPPRAVHGSAGPGLLGPRPSGVRIEHGDQRSEVRDKTAEPLLLGVCRIGVRSPQGRGRRRLLLRGVLGALRGADAAGVRTRVRAQPGWLQRDRLLRRVIPLTYPQTLNAVEIAALVAFPINGPQVRGLSLGASRLLAPSVAISADPNVGVVLARSTFPGSHAPVVLRDADRLEHVHVMGPTGTGKSTLLAQMALQDAERGHAVIVIDPKGDLASDIAARLPEHRLGDVIILDPADAARPVGYNPLAADGRDLDLVVDSIAAVFHGLFSQFWGPRTDDILRSSLLTLGQADLPSGEGYTLCEIPPLLTHQGFRRNLTAGLTDPIGLQPFWAVYESLRPTDRANVIAPLQNKLRAFLLRKSLRTMLGQSAPNWSIESVMANRQILLVPLRAGQIGEEAAQLLGSLVVARIWHATLARSRLPAADRHPVMVILDEFHTLINVPTSLGDLLAQARGLGVAMTLAHQHLGQLSPELRRDLANTRSRVLFQLGAEDARFFARGMPELDPDDLSGLPSREVVISLSVDAQVQPALTARTMPLGSPLRTPEAVADQSRQRFGVDADIAEAALRARHPQPAAGRTKRTKPSSTRGDEANGRRGSAEQQLDLQIGEIRRTPKREQDPEPDAGPAADAGGAT